MQASFPSLLRLFLIGLLLGAAGCGRTDAPFGGAETDDENFRHGKELERLGQSQEALASFLKVIDERGDDAPEAHLEAGILYQTQVRDPIAAIYHYRKFRTLRPTSPQADLVKQRIDAAMREFGRTLPGQPLENGRLDANDQRDALDRLERENTLLREQLAAARGGLPVPRADSKSLGSTPALVSVWPPSGPAAGPSPVVPAPPAAPSPVVRPTGAPPAPKPSPAAASGKKHVVASGDTLSTIAQRYLGAKNRWPEILAANKDILPSEKTPLKVGMELKIP